MYYRLKPYILLRGWQKLPYAIVDMRSVRTHFISGELMDILELANGKVDFALPLISDQQREIAQKLENDGILSASAEPDPIREKQQYHFHDNRYMEVAHWSITGRCNYKCKHCYMSACENKYGELPTEDIMEIIRQLYDCGVHRVSLTGGEALVRDDFFEIVDALLAHDIVITTVYSNGQLVTGRTLAEFEKRRLYPEFNMSFDGTKGWHDWLRGVPGAGRAIDRAFRLCREHGFPTGAEMCLHEQNKHTLRDSVNYLASVGCHSLKTNPIADVGAWHDGGYGKSIDMKELLEVYLDYIPKFIEDGRPLDIQLGGFFSMPPEGDFYYVPSLKNEKDLDRYCVCGHARNYMYISAEGRAMPCMSLSGMDIQEDYPLILDKGLRYCLTESAYMDLITKKARAVIDHNERCRECTYASRCCGGCRAAALETTPDDILGIDETACMIIRDGYVERIEQAVKSVMPEAIRR